MIWTLDLSVAYTKEMQFTLTCRHQFSPKEQTGRLDRTFNEEVAAKWMNWRIFESISFSEDKSLTSLEQPDIYLIYSLLSCFQTT